MIEISEDQMKRDRKLLNVICCGDLYKAFGSRYSAAQNTLEMNGWVYMIQYDAWFPDLRRFIARGGFK